MLAIKSSEIYFGQDKVELEIAYGNGLVQTFEATLPDLEKAIVDLAKIRLMMVIEQEKGVKLTEVSNKEFEEQTKGIRSILLPQEQQEAP